jgi:hypothetical protein
MFVPRSLSALAETVSSPCGVGQGEELLVFLEGHTRASPGGGLAALRGAPDAPQAVHEAHEAPRGASGGASEARADAQGPQAGRAEAPGASPLVDGWEALAGLAARAALVITEESPVPPDVGWLARLAADPALGPAAAVWAVDAACTLPMRLVPPGVVDKAYKFRSTSAGPRKARMRDCPYAGGAPAAAGAAAAGSAAGDTATHVRGRSSRAQQPSRLHVKHRQLGRGYKRRWTHVAAGMMGSSRVTSAPGIQRKHRTE